MKRRADGGSRHVSHLLPLLTISLLLFGCTALKSHTSPYGDGCIQQEGVYRCWNIHVPADLSGTVPLVIDLHGWKGTPSRQRGASGFDSLADKEGFIIVWPYGLEGKWNTEAEPASEQGIPDDVGFLRALVLNVSEDYAIDLSRIYVTGHSMGCAMAQRFANETSDTVAAMACMSHYLLVPRSADYSPVSVMEIHGLRDDTVAYRAGADSVGAEQNLDIWKGMNNCAGDPVETMIEPGGRMLTYAECAEGTEVSLLSLEGVGHYPYRFTERNIDTTKIAWEFMRRFAK